jgi:hypothetical protein
MDRPTFLTDRWLRLTDEQYEELRQYCYDQWLHSNQYPFYPDCATLYVMNDIDKTSIVYAIGVGMTEEEVLKIADRAGREVVFDPDLGEDAMNAAYDKLIGRT